MVTLVFFIIALVLLIWYVGTMYVSEHYTVYMQGSNGTFDPQAQMALQGVMAVQNPSAMDYLNYANLMRYNYLGGDLSTVPASGYTIGGKEYGDTLWKKKGARNDALSRLERRREAIRRASRGYKLAAEHAMRNPGPQTGAVLDAVEGFIREVNDANNGAIARRVEGFTVALGNADEQLALELDINAQRAEHARRMAAKMAVERSTHCASPLTTALDLAHKGAIKSDPQSVHDSKVNDSLRTTLAKLQADEINSMISSEWAGPPLATDNTTHGSHDIFGAEGAATYASRRGIDPAVAVSGAMHFIDSSDEWDPERKRLARSALDKISECNYVSTLEATEGEIFALVWNRTNRPENLPNQQLMREAIVNALMDCATPSGLVCANGRCGRVLTALATLDFDPEVGHAATLSAYKHQIYEETKVILEGQLALAKASDDASMRKVGLEYNTPEGATTDFGPAGEAFRRSVRQAITANMQKYERILTPKEMSDITTECLIFAGAE